MDAAPYYASLTSTTGQWYALAIAVILMLLLATRRLGILFFVTAFPVTLAHELMHLLLGFLSFGQPSGFRVWPQRTARGYLLGSVTCRNVRWYNGLLIGLAPVLLLPLALGLLHWRLHVPPQVNAAEAAWAYAAACLVAASLPSWQDLRVALASSWLLIAVLVIIAIAGTSSW